ncbi:MAG: Bug family tripartite tricarboxylate transporter substrate binding protein [Hyphomicrobiaceae bacterium]
MGRLAIAASALFAAATLGLGSLPATAQDLAGKPIRLIVPWAPGGNIDITARAIAPGLGEALGTTVIVENKPGAGGTIGTAQVATALPDGHTLTLGSTAAMTISPSIYKNAGYDPVKDLAAIGPIHEVPLVLSVAINTPVKNWAEFLAHAKARDGKLSVGTAGVGSTNHLTIELISKLSGAKTLHVPYKGSGPALNDLVSGQLEAMVDQTPSSLPHIKEGRIRPIAITSRKRIASLPDLPTLDELGLKGFEASTFSGLFGPAGLSPALRAKLSAALTKVLADPAVRERFKGLGAEMLEMDPPAFAAFVKSDFEKWAKIVQEAKITVD